MPLPSKSKRSKYGAVKVEIDGTKYDSRKEARRGEELKMLERAGLISDLRFQVRFTLQDGFIRDGVRIRPIEYVADAVYVENGITIVEDTKSTITQKKESYRLKKKLFLHNFPDLTFREYI